MDWEHWLKVTLLKRYIFFFVVGNVILVMPVPDQQTPCGCLHHLHVPVLRRLVRVRHLSLLPRPLFHRRWRRGPAWRWRPWLPQRRLHRRDAGSPFLWSGRDPGPGMPHWTTSWLSITNTTSLYSTLLLLRVRVKGLKGSKSLKGRVLIVYFLT